jgi:hypothetical protein
VSVRFYLYFPAERDAREAADELRSSGYDVRCEEDHPERQWLVLVSTEASPTQLHELEPRFEALADRLNGDYDGHEFDL